MTKLSLMLRLPEVAYFVEKVPIARVVIKPSAVHLRYFQHARDAGISFKAQCEALDIPWHARKIPADCVSKNALKVARMLSASLFAQTMPSDREHFERWVRVIVGCGSYGALPPHSQVWLAHHAVEYPLGGENEFILSYLRSCGSLNSKASVEDVRRWAQKKQDVAARERAIRGPGDMLGRPIGLWNDGGIAVPDVHREAILEMMRRTGVVPVHLGFDRARGEPREPIVYPIDNFRHGALEVTLLRTAEEFDAIGVEMQNCIGSRDGFRNSADGWPRQVMNFFAAAKAGHIHIAVIRSGQAAVAVASFNSSWSPLDVKGRRNSLVPDDVRMAAYAFGDFARHVMPNAPVARGYGARRTIVDEAQQAEQVVSVAVQRVADPRSMPAAADAFRRFAAAVRSHLSREDMIRRRQQEFDSRGWTGR
jgi:hypothetical protein